VRLPRTGGPYREPARPAAVALRTSRDVILRTETLGEAARFYRDVLGLPVTMRRDGLIGFETGSFQLFVEEGAVAHGPVFELLVADVEGTKARLIAAGCTVVEEDPRVPRCYLRDPFGLVFNLGRR
jgi:catechol 2,3-dioxygenase-like lactoylglutathione lyase family enzyme